jgi:hypothetical protein
MSARAVRTTSRIAFFLCGLISLFTGVPFLMPRGAELPVQSEWILFVAALALVGLPALLRLAELITYQLGEITVPATELDVIASQPASLEQPRKLSTEQKQNDYKGSKAGWPRL